MAGPKIPWILFFHFSRAYIEMHIRPPYVAAIGADLQAAANDDRFACHGEIESDSHDLPLLIWGHQIEVPIGHVQVDMLTKIAVAKSETQESIWAELDPSSVHLQGSGELPANTVGN